LHVLCLLPLKLLVIRTDLLLSVLTHVGVPSTIEHFYFDCATSADRLLVTMAVLRLGLVRKKTLIFVNTVDQVGVFSPADFPKRVSSRRTELLLFAF
jgi:thioester reductase-like protein